MRKMVENLVKRKECTSKRKIDALELLGASIALSENAVEGFSYLKRGMEERFNEGVSKSRNPEPEPETEPEPELKLRPG